ncbi:MAG: peptidylprolyl isomerase [Planctomycetes bacterium]|nr:peptidylprolyl isomerase [Planctomycetota bacterium]
MQDNIKDILSRQEVSDAEISVAHILISFRGTGTDATRSQEEAETLATEVFAKVKAGEDFDALAQEYSDDKQGGIAGGPYGMFMPSRGSTGGDGMYPRSGMVPAFGNVGWKLAVGDVGVAAYDRAASPYGWHIIKRVS